jgi:hypothetical protein
MRPRILDLYCGAGGAAVGYHRAGFNVVGVDIAPQPNYPFEFHQEDALRVLRVCPGDDLGPWYPLEDFDAIHASPPCQAFTQMSARWRGKGGKADEHLNLLTPTLELLEPLEIPWVVENVPGAKQFMRTDLMLHGAMFHLPNLHRPRRFQSNVFLMAPGRVAATPSPIGVYGKVDGRTTYRYRNNGNMKGKSLIRAWKSIEEGQRALGIDWTDDPRELAEAIPPAYTEFIGAQLLARVGARAEA